MQKTSQFKTQCKGDISHAFETAKITVFYPMVCKTRYKIRSATRAQIRILPETEQY